jgi:hypothetical protein
MNSTDVNNPATSPRQGKEQPDAMLDLGKIARLLDIADTTKHDGEAVNAVRLIGRELHKGGMGFADLLDGYRQSQIATEAAEVLLAENTELRAEVERLRVNSGAAPWQEIGAAVSNVQTAALWAIDLYAQGQVWLTEFEIGFLRRCTTWRGRLTPKMQPVFRRILDRVVTRTGRQPPP